MLITGESGAGNLKLIFIQNSSLFLGKTENTKKVISYFARIGANANKDASKKTVSLFN